MKKLMYIWLLILVATGVAAQKPYVIDSVCINGMDRYYRIVGDEGYTYDWRIIDTTYHDTIWVTGNDLMEISGTDTTWLNEIAHTWDHSGIFEIYTEVYSEHKCDTLEQGIVKVFEPPFVEAGDGVIYCEYQDITLTTDLAEFYSGLYWETTGDGSFSNGFDLHPTYYLGASDSLTGSVTLILTAYGLAENETCIPAVDSVTFEFSWPEITVAVDSILCYGDSSASITATVTGGQGPYNYEWEGPAGFVSTNSNYITGLWAGTYVLTVTDKNLCVAVDTVILSNPPELIVSIDNIVDVSCFGYSNGAISASATGGTGNYLFNWINSEGTTYTGSDLTNLPASTYYLTLLDENNCIKNDTVIISQPDTLLAEVISYDSILCRGEETVILTRTIGGTGTIAHSWAGSGAFLLNITTSPNVIFSNASPGTYELIYSIIDEANCEASDTIEIVVYPPSYSYDTLEICAFSPSFPWNSQIVTSDMDRIYRDTLFGMNQYGCDSILSLDVKVLFPESLDTTLYVCENEEPFTVFNTTILPGRDSIYLDTLPYVESGCDSLLITIRIETLPVSDTTMYLTLCSGAEEFPLNNRWIQTDSSQVYLDTLQGANIFGCDSFLTYDVTIIPPDTFFVYDMLCQDAPVYAWNDTVIVQTAYDSIYEARLQNINGCDSMVYLAVTIIPSTEAYFDEMLCYGDSMFWINRNIYAEYDSIYLDTLMNVAGCDSLVTLALTVNYPDTINLDTSLCEGSPSFAWGTNGQTIYTLQDSIYSETLTNRYGCDSTVNLAVKILFPRDSLETIEICENELPFAWSTGHTILPDRDSIYYDTLYYAAGCDSLRLQLEVISHPVTDSLINMTVCEGSPEFDWNGRMISTYVDSIYVDTLQNQWSCDSIVTLIIDVIPTYKDTIPAEVCYGEPTVDWYGQVISSEIDSIYFHTVPDPFGCDTLLYYDVKILPVTDAVLELAYCSGTDSVKVNNVWVQKDSSRVYFDNLTNSFGCDSLLTYIVTIIQPDTTLVYDTICYNQPVADWNGIPIQSLTDDVYQVTLTNSASCDSLVILYTTVVSGSFNELFVSECDDFTWIDGKTYTRDTIVDYIIGNENCGDTTRLNLAISLPLDIEVDSVNVLCYGESTGFIELTIVDGVGPFKFKWNTGDTTSSISNLPAGIYGARITDDLECEDTITVVIEQPDSISIDEIQVVNVEVNGESTGSIDVDVYGGSPDYTFVWINEDGVVVGTTEDLVNLPAGEYTLTVTDDNGCEKNRTFIIEEPVISVCLDKLELTCFEDLENYPLIDSLEEYLTYLTASQIIDPGCGIDTASFAANKIVINNSSYCYEELRTYTLLDICNGDTIFYCEQQVIVNDKEDPEINCADITVSNGIIPAPYADATEFRLDGGFIDDNCGIVSFRQIGTDVSDGGSDPEIITRTYEVEDYCGNTARCTQTIKVFADVDLALECGNLPDEYYECSLADIPSHRTLADFFADGGKYYSSIEIDTFYYTEVVSGAYCPTVTRTYYLINIAGDIATCKHTFEIIDNVAPIMTLPDKHIYCGDPLPRRSSGNVTNVILTHPGVPIESLLWDNCGWRNIKNIDFRDDRIIGTCPTVYERLYYVYDNCDNMSEAYEYIYVWDTIPPVITNFPADITADDCIIPNPYTDASAFATDDCASTVTMTSRDSTSASDPNVLYRIYSFSDGCNIVDTVQKITVDFTNVPQFASIDPLCQFSVAPQLPEKSANGITGYWLPDTILTERAGTFEFMFYPDSGQCAGPVPLSVSVTPAIMLSAESIDQGYNPEPVGEIHIDVVDGTGTAPYQYSWNTGDTTQNLIGLYAGIYTVQVTDLIGCTSDSTIEITAGQPTFSCPPDTIFECPDVTQYSPFETITDFINGGGYYNPIGNVADIYSFDDTISNPGYCLTIMRTYVIQDIYGRVDSCQQKIEFFDLEAPVIVAPEGEEAECVSTIIPDIKTLEDFIAYSGFVGDNCTLDSSTFTVTVSEPRFIPSQKMTEITMVYSISDICGNVSYDSTIYIATDTIDPEVYCNNITVYLDEYGNYILTEIDLDTIVSDLTYDNCTPLEDMLIQVSEDEFTCENTQDGVDLLITVYDMAGNFGTCNAHVTVLDTTPPEAICDNITVYLDENGQASISADMLDNGSFDNCLPLDTMFLSKYEFDCNDVGENFVTLTVIDRSGKIDTCGSYVTVIDTILPQIECAYPFTIQLDENAQYTLSVFDIHVDSDDKCGIDTMYLDIYELSCENVGKKEITLTVIDVNGNPAYCTTEITVLGNIAPIAQNDSAITLVNTPVDVNAVINDYDVKTSINIATLEARVEPRHGSLRINPINGIMTYTPALDFVGVDTVVYQICDDAIPCTPMCAQANVFITVLPLNNPPVANVDSFTATCTELTGNLLDNDKDPDGDQITINTVPLKLPIHGYIILQADGSFTYLADDGFIGKDSMMYEICDNGYPSGCSTAWVYFTKYPDADCDGIANIDDIDDDNDGILDVVEDPTPGNRTIDTDGDGIPNSLDIDSDDDGIPDNVEGQGEHDYIFPIGIDANNNGWDDAYDPAEGGYEFVPVDTDSDSTPDYLDIDSDGDGVWDFIEGHDINADGIPDVTRIFVDSDRDGLDDIFDIVDGWNDPYSVINSLGSNAPLQDFDGDGTRDWRDINDEDDEFLTIIEDNNHDGDYSNDDLDLDGYPDYLDKTLDCELFIPEGFSPNDDGVHDFFQILCIQKYPNAHLMIFNRNGDKLFDKEYYGNLDVWGTDQDAWWWGTTENRLTFGRSGGLPAGNYVYVIELGNGEVKNGTVMISY